MQEGVKYDIVSQTCYWSRDGQRMKEKENSEPVFMTIKKGENLITNRRSHKNGNKKLLPQPALCWAV